jgi:hypothetical protein
MHHRALGKNALISKLETFKKEGKYDCVVPLSGGKDSTYILYYAVKELQLKPIAVNYDSGFQSQIAKQNMQRACEILNVPLVIKKSQLTKRILRANFLLLQYGSGFKPCMNCEVVLRTISINVAKQYSVPCILWGSSALESITDKNYERYKQLGQQHNRQFQVFVGSIKKIAKASTSIQEFLRALHSSYHRICVIVRKAVHVFNRPVKYVFLAGIYRIFIVLQRVQMRVPVKYLFGVRTQVPFSDTPAFIHFYDYIEWDSIRQTRLLEDVLCWKHPQHSIDRFDCQLHCYVNYAHLRAHGISHDGVNFCNMIREQKATREDAFFKEKYVQDTVREECEHISSVIGISRAYLQKYWFDRS